MGTLFYGAGRLRVQIDDRTLLHVMIVTTSKLRRGESFLLSWSDDQRVGGGRSSVWLHPETDLHYKFDGARAAVVDQSWLEAMAGQAASSGGLRVEGATLLSR